MEGGEAGEPLFLRSSTNREQSPQSGKSADINNAIKLARECIERSNCNSSVTLSRVDILAGLLIIRSEWTGNVDDLKEAVKLARQADCTTPSNHSNQADRLNSLANKLESRYEQTGKMIYLHEAIELAREAIETTPLDHPDRPMHLNNLGTKLEIQYEQTEDADVLEEAIDLARRAIDSTPLDHDRRAVRLSNLGNKLEMRYERTTRIHDLEEAIDVAREAVRITPINHPDRASNLNNLANKLESRYEQVQKVHDLEEAIEVAREAVNATPSDHCDWATYMNNLGTKLENQYERTGEFRVLEEAIKVAQQAVDSTPFGHVNRAGRLSNVDSMLEKRYERTGEEADLNESIKVAQKAVNSIQLNHPDRAAMLSNLGNKLARQYERTGKIGDLEESIKIAREAVNSTQYHRTHRATCLSNLGNKLESRYEQTNQLYDLQEAINATQQAVDITSLNRRDWAGNLSNLGNKLERRFERTGELVDLEEAIKLTRQAVDSTPLDDPDQARYLSNLGSKLQSRYKRTGVISDLHTAFALFHMAVLAVTAVPFQRIRAAARYLNISTTLRVGDEAIEVGSLALALLPVLHTRILSRSDQQYVLSAFTGIASDLCAYYLSANRPQDALQCLERGRAVIVGQLLDDRSDVSALARDCPILAERYQRLVHQLNTTARSDGDSVTQAQISQPRCEITAELDKCLTDIRSTIGHEHFLLGQTIDEMQQCARDGPIIIVNVTNLRSDALVLSYSSLCAVPLPELTADHAQKWLETSWISEKRSEQRRLNDEFLEYLSWLWHACVKPILDKTFATEPRTKHGQPRVWWIGCGLASSMPFHAAGLHASDPVENAYCRVVSSYTPSIKALCHARQKATRSGGGVRRKDQLLIATMPTTPKRTVDGKSLRILDGVSDERDAILAVLGHDNHTTFLPHPNVEQTLHFLKRCRIAHFACHGYSNSVDPLNSGLILQKNGPEGIPEQDFLSVQRISEIQLQHAWIAYLSACSTAENKAERLTDEVIHVASGFQVAGFPHVVGCLWPAGDTECVEVAKGFYEYVFDNKASASFSGDVALALQEAVMKVRAEDISMPLNWAQFVHFGA